MKLRGIYIDDDPSNIAMYTTLLEEDTDIEIVNVDILETPQEYYEIICMYDIDFVIIDKHLDKTGAKYDGFDVLDEIRKKDSYIHIVLLTNDEIAHSSEYSEFDQTVKKGDLFNESENIVSRIKRSHILKKSIESSEQVKYALKMQKKNIDLEIEKLDEIHETLKNLIN